MATAGWYPDPSGQPGAFRYWDGAHWSQTVTDTPYGPPPAGTSPPPPPPPPPGYQSYAAVGPLLPPAVPGSPGAPGGVEPSAHRSGRALGLLLVALLVTLALGVATFFVVRGLIEEPDPAASGLTSDTTGAPSTGPSDASGDEAPATGVPDPSEAPSGADLPTGPPGDVAPTVEQCTGGLPEQGVSGRDGQFMTGGGLRVRTPEGFEPTLDQAFRFTFADGVYAPSKIIEVTDTSGWVAVYALGSLNRGNGLDSPRQAAEVVMTCMLQSTNFYSDVTITYQLGSEETVVDGNPAWLLSQEVHIDDPELSVEGDVAKVVVVDTGDPAAYALFVSVVPIGDQVLIDEQDATIGALEVP